ncbi:MAG: four helix bundle protein [Elusimicrobiota bacterium]
MGKAFYELWIWQKGYEILMKIYELTAKFPKEERYGLTAQLGSSANLVIANIAEAHGRYYFADKVRVLYISRGECEETRSHLRVALGRKYISNDEFNYLDSGYEGLSIGINNYIQTLKERKSQLT